MKIDKDSFYYESPVIAGSFSTFFNNIKYVKYLWIFKNIFNKTWIKNH